MEYRSGVEIFETEKNSSILGRRCPCFDGRCFAPSVHGAFEEIGCQFDILSRIRKKQNYILFPKYEIINI